MNMEEKLELRHLAPYLPYGLKIANKSLKGQIISVYEMEVENHNDKGIMNVLKGVNQIPLLHPLSRLTEKDANKIGYQYASNLRLHIRTGLVRINFWEQLVKEHWDVFDLIPKGLALPIEPQPIKTKR